MSVLDTPRLTLRPWSEEDAPGMLEIFSDLEAMRFWNAPPSRDVEQMAAVIRRSVAVPPEFHAAWAVVMKQTGRIVGFVNYHHRDVANCRKDVWYILARVYWRQGLATEAMKAFLAQCFGGLQANRVEATIDTDNEASIRFAEGLGFRRESGPLRERLKMPDGRFANVLMFGLLASDWR